MSSVSEQIRLQLDRHMAALQEASAAGDDELVGRLVAQIEDLTDVARRVDEATDIYWSPHDGW